MLQYLADSNIQDIYPLTPMQEGMYFHFLNDPESPAFIAQVSSGLQGRIELELVKKSLDLLTDRHEVLRTAFSQDQMGRPHQMVLKKGNVDVSFLDFSGEGPDDIIKQKVNEFRNLDRLRQFDLTNDVLVRVFVIKTSADGFEFIFSYHHIIMDGWCTDILFTEYDTIYNGLLENKKVTFPASRPFKLWGGWPVMELPVARRKGDERRFEGEELRFSFGEAGKEYLELLAGGQSVSRLTVLAAVVKTVLYRYTGQTEVLLGVMGEKEVASGTIPLLTRFGAEDSFSELSCRVDRTVRDGVLHGAREMRLLWEELGKERRGAGCPWEEVLVLVREAGYDPWGMEVFSRSDLVFDFSVSEGGLMLRLIYNGDIYSAVDMGRLGSYVEMVLGCVGSDAGVLLKEIPLVLPEEEEWMGVLWGAEVLLGSKPADELIAEMAGRKGEEVAIVDGGGRMSYGELDRSANRIARRLIRVLGAGGEKRVAVVLPRSAVMIRDVLAIWKAGMCYIPLDAQWPGERVVGILADAGVSAVIGERWWLEAMGMSAGDGGRVIWEQEGLEEESMAYEETAPEVVRELGDLAYVLYTSGSTGKPKGAMVEHGGMLNHLQAKIGLLGIGEESRILQNASLTFDISVWQCFAALLVGGRTIVYPQELILDARSCLRRLGEDGITIAEFVPSYLDVLLEEQGVSGPGLPALRYLVVTGEAVSGELTRRWFRAFPPVPMINAYGPTEASDDITHHKMEKAPEGDFVPLGEVIANMRLYVLNEELQRCPPGIKGELCVAGVGVGRGYIGDKERTEAVFMDNPFDGGRYRRLYRTGDMVRWQRDGTLEFLGREDEQVKMRGYRIELGEIERTVVGVAGVRQCVVVVRKGKESENTGLVGYVVAKEFDRSALMAYLKGQIPKYMVPQEWVELEALPLTANGKIDRRRLPNPDTVAEGAGNRHRKEAFGGYPGGRDETADLGL